MVVSGDEVHGRGVPRRRRGRAFINVDVLGVARRSALAADAPPAAARPGGNQARAGARRGVPFTKERKAVPPGKPATISFWAPHGVGAYRPPSRNVADLAGGICCPAAAIMRGMALPIAGDPATASIFWPPPRRGRPRCSGPVSAAALHGRSPGPGPACRAWGAPRPASSAGAPVTRRRSDAGDGTSDRRVLPRIGGVRCRASAGALAGRIEHVRPIPAEKSRLYPQGASATSTRKPAVRGSSSSYVQEGVLYFPDSKNGLSYSLSIILHHQFPVKLSAPFSSPAMCDIPDRGGGRGASKYALYPTPASPAPHFPAFFTTAEFTARHLAPYLTAMRVANPTPDHHEGFGSFRSICGYGSCVMHESPARLWTRILSSVLPMWMRRSMEVICYDLFSIGPAFSSQQPRFWICTAAPPARPRWCASPYSCLLSRFDS